MPIAGKLFITHFVTILVVMIVGMIAQGRGYEYAAFRVVDDCAWVLFVILCLLLPPWVYYFIWAVL